LTRGGRHFWLERSLDQHDRQSTAARSQLAKAAPATPTPAQSPPETRTLPDEATAAAVRKLLGVDAAVDVLSVKELRHLRELVGDPST
jgi:hypothetical protein